MPRPAVRLPPLVLPLPDRADRPLRWRLHQGLKEAILNGQFGPGARLPSTRTLARSFGVSRSTVVEAFDLLTAEGFIESRGGSGTYVSRELGALARHRHARPAATDDHVPTPAVRPSADPPGRPAFTPCVPDADLFPHQKLARLLSKRAASTLASDPDSLGTPRLRAAIAAHLALSRGVRSSAERTIVVTGARQGLYLAAQVLLQPGHEVWVEDPGYQDARELLTSRGARAQPVPVDRHGIDVEAGRRLVPKARAAYVTPSHQFPTGAIMSLGRRLNLLEWAGRTTSWILEDDYDSEFCYDKRPLPALQGLDHNDSVIYIGTLNKIVGPGLRVGYLVVPAGLADRFQAAAAEMSTSPSVVLQEALADFITDGHLARHIHRMRETYRNRQETMISELRARLGESVAIEPCPVGMHIVATLNDVPADEVKAAARHRGLTIRTLSDYTTRAPADNAIIIGYTHLEPDAIRSAVHELAEIVGHLRR